MTIKILKYIGHFLFLILLQAFVFKNILLFGVIHPFIYLFFLLIISTKVNRNLLLLISFFIGFVMDVFSSTYGLHISAMLFVALFRDLVLKAIVVSDEDTQYIEPHIKTLGLRGFTIYLFALVFIHHFVLFLIHGFSFENILWTLFKIFINTIVSSILIFVYELLFFYNNKETE
jgi:rod shape-determining protein MreD